MFLPSSPVVRLPCCPPWVY